MLNIELVVIKAEMNALLDAIREANGERGVERYVAEAVEAVHCGKVETEIELLELLRTVVRRSRPPLLSTKWEEAWGNLFYHLIQMILSAGTGSRTVIAHLLRNEQLPPEAEREVVLCINTGSTSTKLALFRGLEIAASDEVHLPPDFDDTIETRADAISEWVARQGIGRGDCTGIACRGGFVKPVPAGTFEVCRDMVSDLGDPAIVHASNMAIPIGLRLREKLDGGEGILVTTTDPVASDEMETGARLTGIRRILRHGSGAHYLNQRAIHRLVSSLLGFSREELVTIGAHMGGGISIVRHSGGKIVDLVNAFSGVPSANRCGNIPLDCMFRAIDEGSLSLLELKDYLFAKGGLIDLTGTNDFRTLMHFMDTGAVNVQRRKIELVLDFMARSIAGAIMSLAAVEQAIDMVILSGGLSRSSEFVDRVRRKLFPYFPVVVVPGSIEYEALVAGHMRARFVRGGMMDYVKERDALRRLRAEERNIIETEIFSRPQLRRKENAPVASLDEMVHMAHALVARHSAPKIAIVGAENEDAIAAAKQANEDGRYPVARFILVGDFREINRIAWEYDIKIDGDNYAISDTNDPVGRAVELLASGEADLLMKGGVKTEEIMRGALRYLKESGCMKKGRIYSHVGFFQIPAYPKLLLVTDAALIPAPSQKIKKKILENALTVARYLNIDKPRVAVISAVETMNPSVESSMLAGEFARDYRDRDDCIVEGPLSLDVAMDSRSAHEKKYPGRIKGNADIILMPDIEAGNVVYKTLTVTSGACLAGAIVGAGVPIVLTSRGDSARSKLASICLACIIAMKQGDIAPGKDDG